MKRLYSVEDAAEVLSISKWTVRKYISEGKLSAVRIGTRVLLEDTELERFISDCKEQPEEAGVC